METSSNFSLICEAPGAHGLRINVVSSNENREITYERMLSNSLASSRTWLATGVAVLSFLIVFNTPILIALMVFASFAFLSVAFAWEHYRLSREYLRERNAIKLIENPTVLQFITDAEFFPVSYIETKEEKREIANR